MRALSPSAIVALAWSAARSSAMPVDTSSLVTRSQFCANAPLTIAGTQLSRRNIIPASSLKPSHPRGVTSTSKIWCAPNSQTYVIVTVTEYIAGTAIISLLDDAYTAVTNHINIWGDGLIADGSFAWSGAAGLAFRTVNANNRQQTWGVLGAALYALGNYMSQNPSGAGTAVFSIFDGGNHVGSGSID